MKWSGQHHSAKSGERYYYACQSAKNFFGKTKVDRINADRIEKFIEWRSSKKSQRTNRPVSRTTINFELAVLKMICKRLFDTKVLRENPARSIKQLPKDENTFYVLSLEEEKRYLLAAPQPLQDVAAIILETGMRCGEVYNLRRKDVFTEKGFLKVVKGKTRSAVRNVHLSEKAKEILTFRMKKFTGENLFPRNDKDGAEPIENLVFQHQNTIKKLGFKFRLYDCRHTFATRAVDSGVDLLTLASMLGHANLKMISRYAHPSEGRKADAVQLMQQAKAENSRKKLKDKNQTKRQAKAV